jgi:hypothetical protein
MQIAWFTALVSAICLEGLGRKYLPQIPSLAFYFLKDAILLFGYFRFPPPPAVQRVVRMLYGGFGIVLVAAFGWTVIEMVNPEHQSWMLALIGLRAYWLWWIAPVVVAGFLQNQRQKRQAVYVLLAISTIVSVLAAMQFASPADSSMNLYSVWGGEEIYASEMATVAATGRARVSSSFSFLSGFVDFCLLVPTLLLSIGLEARETRVRRAAFVATTCAAAVIPMSGSRGSVLLGVSVLAIMAWASGLFFTPIGRRVLIGAVVAAVVGAVAFPDAIFGVQSRFEDTEETTGRILEMAAVAPPVALSIYDYPSAGIGTGMQQNARGPLHVEAQYGAESEVARYLIELGPIGYLLVWTAKLGLVIGLGRAYRLLKNGGRRGAAGAALSYAILTMLGNLTFDHVWQALYFLGCGFIVSEVVDVLRETRALGLRAQQASAGSRTVSFSGGERSGAQRCSPEIGF